MPKAEVGSTKWQANKMKQKGLTRLRWYCQVCEKACRDANAFKQHTLSESHVRQMQIVGDDPRKYINDFSNQFLSDFIKLLKTGHGEKQVHLNRFYQEYIANRDHIHMNATKWPSLTELAKHLSRERICKVEETEKGLHISWIDDSPEALRRRDALKRKEAQDQGNEEVEQRMIREQIRRAQANAKQDQDEEAEPEDRELKRQEGEKIKLSFGAKPSTEAAAKAPAESATTAPNPETSQTETEAPTEDTAKPDAEAPKAEEKPASKPAGFGGMSIKIGGKPQTKNVFAQAKKNALSGGSKKGGFVEQPKKMSEAERIMKEEMERNKKRPSGFSMPGPKKARHD